MIGQQSQRHSNEAFGIPQVQGPLALTGEGMTGGASETFTKTGLVQAAEGTGAGSGSPSSSRVTGRTPMR